MIPAYEKTISAYEEIVSLPFKIVLKPAPGWSAGGGESAVH